jgi:PAS domain S-box-containing protein
MEYIVNNLRKILSFGYFIILFLIVFLPFNTLSQTSSLQLTEDEKAWISAHPVINVGNERFWPPIDFAIDGKPLGYGIDLMNIMAKELGLEINYISGLTWVELMEALKNGDIDILPAISKTAEREAYIKFSKSYINLPYVKVISSTNSTNENFNFEDKVLAVNKGSNIAIAALSAYPKLDTIHVNTLLEGIQKVSTGEADVFIENIGLISYHMNESYIPNIKLVSDDLGFLESSSVQMGVLKKNVILGNLIDKALEAVTKEDVSLLKNKWMPANIESDKEESSFQTSYLWKVVGGILILFILFYFSFKWVFKRIIKEKVALEFGSRKFRVKTNFYLTVLVFVIAAMGWLAIIYIEAEFSDNIKLQLENDLKSANGRLDFWLNQKKDYLKSLGHDQKLIELTNELVEVSKNYNNRQYQTVHNKLAIFFEELNYQGSFIINEEGINIRSVDTSYVGDLNTILKDRPELIKQVFNGDVILVPPLLSNTEDLESAIENENSLMYFLIPIEDVERHVIAAIIQEVDPGLGFSEILQLSHVGNTGESYIFNRKGKMLSKSRFDKNLKNLGVFQVGKSGIPYIEIRDPGGNLTTGFKSEVALDQQPLTIMAKSAIEGNKDVNIEGYNDYRGVPVMGAWMWIDELELGLATEIDVEEALNLFYFIRLSALLVLGITLLIIIGSILFTLTLGEKANVALIKAKDELEERVILRTTELNNEKSLLNSLINAIPDLIFYKDTKFKFLGANAAFEKQIGFKKSKFIGKKDSSFIPEELALEFEKSDALILNKSESVSMESEDKDPEGNLIIFDTKKTPFFDEQGKLLGLIGISRDITQRKKAEIRLKAQSAALKSAANGVLITNTKGEIVWINPAFSILTGYNWKEIVGKTPGVLNSGKHDKSFYSKMWNTILSGKTWQGEIINKKKSGDLFYEEMTITPVLNDKGDIDQFVAIKNDITERKKAEEEIRASENKFRSITTTATDAIISADKKGFIESWNKAAEKIFGYTEQEAKGQKLEIIIPDKYRERHQLGMNRVLGGGEKKAIGRIVELEGQHKNGTMFPIELSLSIFEGKEGMNFSGIIRDITERKKIEEILIKAKKRMEDELNVAKDIQMSMLPLIFPAFPKREEIEIYAELIPAREVGGDFYDFHFIDENHLCFVMADVSGKGVPAALMMAVTKTLLKSRASNDKSPASILTDVNNEIAKDNDSYMFITVFLAILNTNTGELIYSNAGHSPSYIICKETRELTKLRDLHGPVIGAMEGMTYGETKLFLNKNDIVFSYTDGVTESHNIKEELYSDPRLEELLENGNYDSSKALTKLVIQSVNEFAGEAEQFDDITAMAIEYLHNPNTISSVMSSIKIINDLKQITAAIEWFEVFALEHKMPFAIIQKINIALDEILNNIISYGYKDKEVHEIEVGIELRSARLIIIINDDGMPFNPFKNDPPDTMLTVEERMIGGLGIHLVKKLMDEYEYKRHINKNIITLIKHNINT